MELSPLSVILLLISLIPVSQAQGSPKAVVSIKPDTHVFIGETVTLRCDIQGGGDTQWTYSWMKNNYGLYIDGSKRAYAMQEFIIWSVEDSDSGTYTCTGHGRYSQISGSVTLTVSVKPKPTVRVNPQSSVYTGDTVTLSCELQSTGWEFQWYKNNQSQNLYSEEENTLKVTVDNAGETEYKCRARRRNYYYYNDHYYDYYDTEYSDPVKITVRGKPKPTVRVNPQSSVYTGDTVTLSCELQQGTGWRIYWYKNNQLLNLNSEQVKTLELTVNNAGEIEYKCWANRINYNYYYYYTEFSDPIKITVRGKPKPTVRVNPQSSVYTGDTVTLSCELQQETGWRIYWYKNNQLLNLNSEQVKTLKVTVNNAGETEYKCWANRINNNVYYYFTEFSDPIKITVRGKPKPTVRVNPQSSVYTGDTVTLSCELQQETGWRIYWYKNNQLLNLNSEQVKTLELTVDNAGETEYRCRANRINYNYYYYYTEFSDPVNITVRERPQAVVSVSPQSWLTEGDSVTLSCEVTDSSTDWTFSWYTVVPYRDGLTGINNNGGYSVYVELLSDSSRGSGGKYTLSPAALNHTGVYMCRGERGEPALHSQYSNPQPLWITGESPPVSLIFNPSNTQHFTNDSLSLSCEDQSNSAGWTVRRYTHSERVLDCSHWGSVTGSTCNISFLSTSYTGVYWCESESGENSNPVNITVHGSRPGGGSSGRTAGLVVGLGFLFIALLILMILLWSYKRKKEKLQTSAEDSQSGHTPLQAGSANVYATVDELDMAGTGEAAAEISEATYAQVTEKMKTNRNNGADADVTYAEIQLKPMMETKRKKEMASVDDSAVYSEVRKDVQ
ncbi:carcinoembryonic antigen-related cell adhesion molecule 5-like isoform X2 [Hemibagrus wyckioides]|uniref:carcinoembryonic antigen-related cell adhesion molecule 5-like isoform X2 n=1 Tax=Hemibagrus wyckioides TaxID=337641 RepID=UPI00266C470F|nr:carcinoembryonic antigen-related cell adhesion molecule 5-like isoform X2 [Hemibagrus wyckioides]